MKNLLNMLFGTNNPLRGSSVRRRDIRPQVEALEDRLALSTVVLTASGLISIQGTNSNNHAVVSTKDNGNTIKVKADGQNYLFNASAVTGIRFYGYQGDDRFKNKTDLDS